MSVSLEAPLPLETRNPMIVLKSDKEGHRRKRTDTESGGNGESLGFAVITRFRHIDAGAENGTSKQNPAIQEVRFGIREIVEI